MFTPFPLFNKTTYNPFGMGPQHLTAVVQYAQESKGGKLQGTVVVFEDPCAHHSNDFQSARP